ncbi:LLM class flavin-dependent oxidoreductase [Gordonia soli]|uniref:Luciferase-like domain-containing protein n=1 Tax=Gordonia soli NBRC 108243 TaxID=1223545 RepID=M0QLN2_9ACTN|nr:LLM class flavin-dependent oxidoreductase [Gordonia soli]GAC68307.1 hypothetical protein GS4_14_01400 [Gordonia soli NBRC 108243]
MTELDLTAVRTRLGRIGAHLPFIPFTPAVPAAEQIEATRRWERAGVSTVWINEGVGGKDILAQAGILLSATEEVTIATGIANVWARPPQTAGGGSASLSEAFDGRFVLGVGVGYPEQADVIGRTFTRPLEIARGYLDRLDDVVAMSPAPEVRVPRLLAANGPRMLGVARDHADGAIPTLVPPAFTERTRRFLGPDKVLAVGLTIAVDDDAEVARRMVGDFAARVLGHPDSPYADNLIRLGYRADELSTPSDRVIEDLFGFGPPGAIAEAIDRHLHAGADHVWLSSTAPDFATSVTQIESVVGTLTAQGRYTSV